MGYTWDNCGQHGVDVCPERVYGVQAVGESGTGSCTRVVRRYGMHGESVVCTGCGRVGTRAYQIVSTRFTCRFRAVWIQWVIRAVVQSSGW